MFLCSEGALFSKQAQAQFAEVDRVVQSFQEGLKHWETHGELQPRHIDKLSKTLETLAKLPDMRRKILTQSVPISEAIDYYAHQLIGPLLQHIIEIALVMEGNNPTLVSAYNAFIQWKERIGLERAISARGFIGHSFDNQEFAERILFLLSEQNNYQNTYMALASDMQKQLVEQVLEDEACTELKKLHEVLRKSPESDALYALTPEAWFDLITAKIDALHTVEIKLVDSLREQETPVNETTHTTTDHALAAYESLIDSLQLFSGLSDNNRQMLLQHGQIREFHKGKLLFLEGEQSNRLYVILKGWIKIFKGTAGGEETILQMLSAGDSIMESAVFLGTPFPVNAQVAEHATLLSLPAPMIREQVKNNNELALNLLASMSYRSQGLIRQIENARLKSVDERTGWFLLKLLLEQGRLSRTIELPYDKSLIASYLDMKRETFSRALKRLKEKGFTIENNTITIPSLSSLCNFCDPDTAAICTQHGKEGCSNTQCDTADVACVA